MSSTESNCSMQLLNVLSCESQMFIKLADLCQALTVQLFAYAN